MLISRLFATCITLSIKFNEELVFTNDHQQSFFYEANFVDALYINLAGLVDPAAIHQDKQAFQERLLAMQQEVLQAIDYALYVSEETYKGYTESFIDLYRKQKKNAMKQSKGGTTSTGAAAGTSTSTMSTASGVEEEKK